MDGLPGPVVIVRISPAVMVSVNDIASLTVSVTAIPHGSVYVLRYVRVIVGLTIAPVIVNLIGVATFPELVTTCEGEEEGNAAGNLNGNWSGVPAAKSVLVFGDTKTFGISHKRQINLYFFGSSFPVNSNDMPYIVFLSGHDNVLSRIPINKFRIIPIRWNIF